MYSIAYIGNLFGLLRNFRFGYCITKSTSLSGKNFLYNQILGCGYLAVTKSLQKIVDIARNMSKIRKSTFITFIFIYTRLV